MCEPAGLAGISNSYSIEKTSYWKSLEENLGALIPRLVSCSCGQVVQIEWRQ